MAMGAAIGTQTSTGLRQAGLHGHLLVGQHLTGELRIAGLQDLAHLVERQVQSAQAPHDAASASCRRSCPRLTRQQSAESRDAQQEHDELRQAQLERVAVAAALGQRAIAEAMQTASGLPQRESQAFSLWLWKRAMMPPE